LKIEAQEVAANSTNSIVFNVTLPKDFQINTDAPNRFEIMADGKNIKLETPKGKFDKLPLSIPFEALQKGATSIKAKFTVYYCREDKTGECLIKTLSWNVPVKFSDKAANSQIQLTAEIEK
jgi:hypothetical protein